MNERKRFELSSCAIHKATQTLKRPLKFIDISRQNASKSLCLSHALPKRLNQLLRIEFSSLQMANLCGKCFQRFPQQMNGVSNHKSMWIELPLHTHP